MAHQASVKTVFNAVVEALPKELGALLGQELSCSGTVCNLVSKEQLLAELPRSSSTLAHLKVSGDREGDAFLILPLKTSIIFGGTLIMLPQEQIEERILSGTLDDEITNAYGEVANILAGVLTQVFLDKYPKNLRYIRTNVEELVGSEIDMEADEHFAQGNYFHLATELEMDSENLGRLEVIIPVTILDLEGEAPETLSSAAPQQPTPEEIQHEEAPAEAATTFNKTTTPATPQPELIESKNVIDNIIRITVDKMSEGVSTLLGQIFSSGDLKLEMVHKNDLFTRHCCDKSILTHMKINGEASGTIFLITPLKEAILLGGTLIMLPDKDIQSQISHHTFEGEVADAYGEIANIISTRLTQSFQKNYPKQLGFVKSSSEIITPAEITPTEATPIPDGLYYMASFLTVLHANPLDRMFLIFPAEVFGLEHFATDADHPQATADNNESATTVSIDPDFTTTSARQTLPMPPADAAPILLVIADNLKDAEAVNRSLPSDQYEVRVIGFKDDIRPVFSSNPVLGIFLLMSEVGEKGFSVAIKLQSSGYPLPPVIAGGEWTRSSVLRAIKYGARDILITPASDDEVRDKASQHIAAPA